jgi:hypothetical protein
VSVDSYVACTNSCFQTSWVPDAEHEALPDCAHPLATDCCSVGAGTCTSLCTAMQWLTSRCLHQLVYRAYTTEFAQENPAPAELFQSNAKVWIFLWQVRSTTPPSKAIQGLQVLNFAQGGCKVILKHITTDRRRVYPKRPSA